MYSPSSSLFASSSPRSEPADRSVEPSSEPSPSGRFDGPAATQVAGHRDRRRCAIVLRAAALSAAKACDWVPAASSWSVKVHSSYEARCTASPLEYSCLSSVVFLLRTLIFSRVSRSVRPSIDGTARTASSLSAPFLLCSFCSSAAERGSMATGIASAFFTGSPPKGPVHSTCGHGHVRGRRQGATGGAVSSAAHEPGDAGNRRRASGGGSGGRGGAGPVPGSASASGYGSGSRLGGGAVVGGVWRGRRRRALAPLTETRHPTSSAVRT